jgi:hypothetical protein
MKWFLTLLSLLSAALFLALESIVLVYAINNKHFAYYYALIGFGSVLSLFAARYLHNKNATPHPSLKILVMFTHGVTFLLLLSGVLVLTINYYFNESI